MSSITIEISDTGHGIPPTIIDHVFDKGFTYGKEGGTGLGLYYARRFVENHQGNIDINSREGLGTAVILHIPRSPTPIWHIGQLDFRGIDSVIVCDDQPGILKSWQMRFKSLANCPSTAYFSSCEEIPSISNAGLLIY